MSVERRPDERVSVAKQATSHKGSLFQPTTHSKPILGNRKPVPGALSKPPIPTTEEVLEAEREFKGAEKLEKSASVLGEAIGQKATDGGGGNMFAFDSGASVWLRQGDPLAGDGIAVLAEQYREQHPTP